MMLGQDFPRLWQVIPMSVFNVVPRALLDFAFCIDSPTFKAGIGALQWIIFRWKLCEWMHFNIHIRVILVAWVIRLNPIVRFFEFWSSNFVAVTVLTAGSDDLH